MENKYYLKGVLVLVNNHKVYINALNQEALGKDDLEKILEDPLSSENYPESTKLSYFPPFANNRHCRQSYAELTYGHMESIEEKCERGTVKRTGTKAVFTGYLDITNPELETVDKALLGRALANYNRVKPK
ncbi:MAG: hypothetical protein M1348_02475 [Candidatus Parvarchaeota archaeon]|nr:hypothetical protein [Candidatus Parvarchaeota archaeon]MCL5101451.1 hypothetical protein [Candidatus Parvarchaeota archaeon]